MIRTARSPFIRSGRTHVGIVLGASLSRASRRAAGVWLSRAESTSVQGGVQSNAANARKSTRPRSLIPDESQSVSRTWACRWLRPHPFCRNLHRASTVGAGAYVASPLCEARMVHMPPLSTDTRLPLTAHTLVVCDANVTLRLDVAVAVSVKATSPMTLFGSAPNAMVCANCGATVKVWATGGAGS